MKFQLHIMYCIYLSLSVVTAATRQVIFQIKIIEKHSSKS